MKKSFLTKIETLNSEISEEKNKRFRETNELKLRL